MNGQLTIEDFNRWLDFIFRKRTPKPEYPRQMCDWNLIAKHNIRMGYDYIADMWMMSPNEMRRAKAVGAIWLEDEHGNRVAARAGIEPATK